jgi:hypothetical protein
MKEIKISKNSEKVRLENFKAAGGDEIHTK